MNTHPEDTTPRSNRSGSTNTQRLEDPTEGFYVVPAHCPSSAHQETNTEIYDAGGARIKDLEVKAKKPKRVQAKQACFECKRSSRKCEDVRPCPRCVDRCLDCWDVARKQRGPRPGARRANLAGASKIPQTAQFYPYGHPAFAQFAQFHQFSPPHPQMHFVPQVMSQDASMGLYRRQERIYNSSPPFSPYGTGLYNLLPPTHQISTFPSVPAYVQTTVFPTSPPQRKLYSHPPSSPPASTSTPSPVLPRLQFHHRSSVSVSGLDARVHLPHSSPSPKRVLSKSRIGEGAARAMSLGRLLNPMEDEEEEVKTEMKNELRAMD